MESVGRSGSIREGTFYVIQAKAVLISTGGTNRLYQNPTGLSFNTWMCPVNTGDGKLWLYELVLH